MNRWKFTLFSLCLINCALAGEIKPTAASLAEIEKSNLPKGEAKSLVKWHDRSGSHYIVAIEKQDGELCSKGYRSELHVLKLTKSADTLKSVWHVKDFGSNPCETVTLIDSSISVIDIDGDGIGESRFAYEFGHDCCDPLQIKYMLHFVDKKLAIRGQVPMTEESAGDYRKSLDKAFSTVPAQIRDYALRDWDILLSKNYEFINLQEQK